MASSKIWYNENFWFRLSLVVVTLWLVFSVLVSMIIYLSWAHHFEALKEMLAEFSTWFFLLPAVASFGILNAVPLVAPWLFSSLESDADSAHARDSVSKASYRNLTDKLREEL